jgi:hypothetical protein
MSYVKYEDKSMVSNTRWPGIVSSALCRENFHAYGMKYCTDGRIGCLEITGLRPGKSKRGMGRSSATPRGFEPGDSNLSKLTVVFATTQLTGPCLCSRQVMPNPHSNNLISLLSRLANYHSNNASKAFIYMYIVFLILQKSKRRLAIVQKRVVLRN